MRPHGPRLITTTAALLAALAVATLAPAARAETPVWGQERGFSLGLKFLVDGLGADPSPDPAELVVDDMGSGLALCGGYSFTPRFHVRLTVGAAQHGTAIGDLDVQRSVGTLEAHYRFMPDRQVCPYVFGSVGGTDVRADQGINHVKFSGSMAGVGAGMLVGLTRHLSMDVTGRVDGVNWDTAEWSQDLPGGTVKYADPIEDSGGSARLELGLLWQF